MSDHDWCRDTARDEAVRAAEDAAAVPAIQHRDLPEQVALLWASVGDLIGRVVRLEGEMDAGQDEEASPAEGLRTERVTLEVTQRVEDYVAPSRWNWCGQLGSHAQPGESVRVVEETKRGRLPDMVARLTAERDAVRAERDAARAECERLSEWVPLRASMEVARLKARVAELEAAAPPRNWLTAEERAAVEEAMVDYASNVGDHDCERIKRVLRALLARSTPPKVRRPNPNVLTITAEARDRMWFAAIRAAGGEVEG